MNTTPQRILALLATFLLVGFCGCGRSKIDQALDSDANGYYCRNCKTKFYTDRKDFAAVCPKCKHPEIDQVIGYVCTNDNHVTLAPRGRGVARCEQCGAPANGRSIPREADLKAWGAVKYTMIEVSLSK